MRMSCGRLYASIVVDRTMSTYADADRYIYTPTVIHVRRSPDRYAVVRSTGPLCDHRPTRHGLSMRTHAGVWCLRVDVHGIEQTTGVTEHALIHAFETASHDQRGHAGLS